MTTGYDKVKSIGCLFCGIGLCLFGVAALVAAVALFRMGADLRKAVGISGGAGSSLTARLAVSNAANELISPAAGADGGLAASLEDFDLSNLLNGGAAPDRMVESLGRVLADPAIRKQLQEFMASDLFTEQMKGLVGDLTSAVPQAVSVTNR